MTAYKTPRYIDVYRFEGRDGVGPYQCNVDPLGETFYDPFKHPLPREEKAFEGAYDDWDELNERYYFGFASLTQCLTWFDDFNIVQKMLEQGYKLYKMTVEAEVPEDVLFGETQVMFIKAKVCRKEELDVLEIYNDCFA